MELSTETPVKRRRIARTGIVVAAKDELTTTKKIKVKKKKTNVAGLKRNVTCVLQGENCLWLNEQEQSTGQHASKIVNEAITSLRTGTKFSLDTYIPKYLAKAQAMYEKRKSRFASK